MDMNHGLFFTPPVTIRAGDYQDCAGSRLIVVTAGARQAPGEGRLDLTKRNATICRSILRDLGPYIGEANVLMITNPVEVTSYVALEASQLAPNRIFGSGTVLDSARFRYELSSQCDVDPRNVHAYVVGEHGESEVFLWSQVHIAGTPLDTFCRSCDRECGKEDRTEIERRVRASAYHIIEAKGYTNYGVSHAVLRIIGAVLRDERSILTVSTILKGQYGLNDTCLSIPCIVGSKGIERIVETRLTDDEYNALMRSAGVIRSAICSLEATVIDQIHL